MRWFAAFLLCTACVGDDSVAKDAGADGSPPVDGGTDVVEASADVFVDAGCTADTQNDPKNCGKCGHDCVGGSCTAGACQVATLVTGQVAVTSLAPAATKLFWARASTQTQHSGIFSSDLDGQNLAMLYDGN